MGSTSRHGRATINPNDPNALGICDRCSFLFNLRTLRWQMEWCGTTMQNLHLRVCSQCWDVPQEQLRTIILPADPPSVRDPRTEPFFIDQVNELTLSKIIGKPYMLLAESTMFCEIDSGLGIVAAFGDTGNMSSAFTLGIVLGASFSDASDVAAVLMRGVGLTAAIDGASNMIADVNVTSAAVARTATDSFGFQDTGSYTETGADIGSAAANRLVFVCVCGINDANDGIDSMTIGGISATLASGVVRTAGAAFVFSEIWWAAVPTGTTANIALTFAGDTISANCAVYKVTGADVVSPIASQNTGSVATGDVSAAVTIGNNTAVLTAAYCGVNTTDTNITWTNATEDYDLSFDIGGVFINNGFASRADAVGPGATTITASPASADLDANKTMAVVVIET